jgi:ammonium transporter, Amt family
MTGTHSNHTSGCPSNLASLDIFSIHCIGGLVGNLLTGLFAADYIAHLDGTTVITGGWLNHHWWQLAYQLADSAAGFVYSFFGTCVILLLINFIPGLHLRASEEDEIMGMDDTEVGEFAVSLTISCILSLSLC